MKQKILILGGSGMAGHVISASLAKADRFTIYSTFFRNKGGVGCINVNAYDKEGLSKVLSEVKPDFVINCVGALIKQSKTDLEGTIYLNSYLPHYLKNQCELRGAKLIHLSTDCVFSGERGGYSELDETDAKDIYGKSKELGEIWDDKHVTIRTSIIGPELKEVGEGLFSWFMNQAGIVKGFNKVIWSGVTTLELAKSIEKVIDNDICGLVHLTNGIPISKYELLRLIKTVWNRNDVELVESVDYVSNKSLLKTEKFDFQVPGYEEMLLELREFMKSRTYKGTI